MYQPVQLFINKSIGVVSLILSAYVDYSIYNSDSSYEESINSDCMLKD